MIPSELVHSLAELLGKDMKTLRSIDRVLADHGLRRKAIGSRQPAVTRREALLLLLASMAAMPIRGAMRAHEIAAAWGDLRGEPVTPAHPFAASLADRPLIDGLEAVVEQVASDVVIDHGLWLELHLSHGFARLWNGDFEIQFTGPITRRDAGLVRTIVSVPGRLFAWIGENID